MPLSTKNYSLLSAVRFCLGSSEFRFRTKWRVFVILRGFAPKDPKRTCILFASPFKVLPYYSTKSEIEPGFSFVVK